MGHGSARRRIFAMVFPLVAASCGAGGSDGTTSTDSAASDARLPCDVESALAAHCQKCHSSPPRDGVPFPLMTYSDTQRLSNLTESGATAPIWQIMGEVIREGRMPLSSVTFSPDPLPDGLPARKTLLDWIAAGAPERASGEAACAQ